MLTQQARGLNELAGVGKRRKDQTAQPRELRTLLGRNRHWPPLFKFQAPVWDRKQQKEVTQTLRVLLPHECLFVMFEKADGCVPLCQQEWLQDVELRRLQQAAARMNVEATEVTALGLWGDEPLPLAKSRSSFLERARKSSTGQAQNPYVWCSETLDLQVRGHLGSSHGNPCSARRPAACPPKVPWVRCWRRNGTLGAQGRQLQDPCYLKCEEIGCFTSKCYTCQLGILTALIFRFRREPPPGFRVNGSLSTPSSCSFPPSKESDHRVLLEM